MLRAKLIYNRLMMLAFFVFLLTTGAQGQDAKIVFQDTAVTDTEYSDDEDEEEQTDVFLPKGDPVTVKPRQVSPLKVKRMREDEDFWYVDQLSEEEMKRRQQAIVNEKENGQKGQKGKNDPAIEERSTQYEDDYQSSGISPLLWILIIVVFIAVLFLYLSNNNVGLFSRRNKKISEMDNVEEEISEDIFAINYQKDIDRAAAQGNYRLAIRLMFLRALKNMSERNIIRYKQDKTNLDYLMELQPTAHYRDFFKVTRNYEYSWYGQFAINEEAYRVIRNEFDQFDKTIR